MAMVNNSNGSRKTNVYVKKTRFVGGGTVLKTKSLIDLDHQVCFCIHDTNVPETG